MLLDEYMDTLLTESATHLPSKTTLAASLQTLLQSVSETPTNASPHSFSQVCPQQSNEQPEGVQALWQRLPNKMFPALLFDIAGVSVAAPLAELGGIHSYVPLQHIVGRPSWYAGYVEIKGQGINCIDGAKWLLLDTHLDKMAGSLHLNSTTDVMPDISYQPHNEYQYIVMLHESNWGIACHNLRDTILIDKDDVNWRDTNVKRPWLAGLIKQQMCAMLDTLQLTDMLDAGLSSNQR